MAVNILIGIGVVVQWVLFVVFMYKYHRNDITRLQVEKVIAGRIDELSEKIRDNEEKIEIIGKATVETKKAIKSSYNMTGRQPR